MSCCGQNREKAVAMTAQPIVKAAPASPPVTRQAGLPVPAPMGPTTKLRYSGVAPIQVKGPGTGRTYVVSGRAPEVTVDRRDAEALMRIGLFRRAV